ncbi:MAG TPA: HAD family phosphatase [Microvirga sp.]|nr:HAD family phosphatase [Microvirga sp.]
MSAPTTVVFDIGNVLLRWNPRNLYRKVFADEDQMEWFLREVCTNEWNVEQDRGRSWDEAVALLVARHPEWEAQIRAFHERWHETVEGVFEDNVAVLERLVRAGIPTYAITNFSSDKFREAQEIHPFLKSFRGVVVSGDERLIKPDRAIFDLFFRRYGLAPAECVFIDDSLHNIETARSLGMHAIHYSEPLDVAAALREHGIAI